jgi:alcohol dehydrogenase class IV
MTSASHGVICGRLLPYVMQANMQALQNVADGEATASGEESLSSEEAQSALARFDEIAHILTGRTDTVALDAVFWIGELSTALGLPGLRKYGLSSADFPDIAAKARKASSMQGNPVDLSEEELVEIITRAIE